jgi:hypothetical protein
MFSPLWSEPTTAIESPDDKRDSVRRAQDRADATAGRESESRAGSIHFQLDHPAIGGSTRSCITADPISSDVVDDPSSIR